MSIIQKMPLGNQVLTSSVVPSGENQVPTRQLELNVERQNMRSDPGRLTDENFETVYKSSLKSRSSGTGNILTRQFWKNLWTDLQLRFSGGVVDVSSPRQRQAAIQTLTRCVDDSVMHLLLKDTTAGHKVRNEMSPGELSISLSTALNNAQLLGAKPNPSDILAFEAELKAALLVLMAQRGIYERNDEEVEPLTIGGMGDLEESYPDPEGTNFRNPGPSTSDDENPPNLDHVRFYHADL